MTSSKAPGLEISERRPCRDWFGQARFPHHVKEMQLIETHISCIVLTGEFAYKVKKRVNLAFVDYSTLERRKHFCELEVKLNRRFSPEVYLGVVPIFQSDDGLEFGKATLEESTSNQQQAGIVDYAVKMRQFPQEAIVANRLYHDELTPRSVAEFGRYIAAFHAKIKSAIPTLSFVQSPQILEDALENFVELFDSFVGDHRFKNLLLLDDWTRSQFKHLMPKFQSRLDSGKVKLCHGDLHLKNIIQVDGNLKAFDGIEFNEQFQYVDILSEIAFPVMDFFARGRRDLGWRLLNAYLEAIGDYADLDVLRYYLVYRAMVRAKVAWLNPGNHSELRRVEYASESNPDDRFAGPWDKFLEIARYFAFELQPNVRITHGFSGSGKSTMAMQVIDVEGGIRIRSDVQRKRLAQMFGVSDKYSLEMSDWVYAHLAETAKAGVQSGFPIIIDAAFLKRNRRQPFIELAQELNASLEIIDCDAPFDELRRRLEARKNDASEANAEVLRMQIRNHDPLSDEELTLVRRT